MIGPYRYEELRALSRNVTGDSDPGQVGAGQPRGKLVIDQGTAEALRRGRNLLPVGIIEVHGEFEQGDRIDLCDISRIRLGWGITHYSSDEIRAIKGLHSDLIGQTLGYTNGSTSIVPRHHLYLD
jgi:glutamate 5-kinase